jgi:hypothetical protein
MNGDRLAEIEAAAGNAQDDDAGLLADYALELVGEVRRLRDGCTCGVADDAS